MKRFFTFLLLFVSLITVDAQVFNYLPNGNFEELMACPDSNQFNGFVADWSSTFQLETNSDQIGAYYHTCDSRLSNWPLEDFFGEGVVRVRPGLATANSTHLPGFIYAKLKRPLEKDSLYYFEYTSASNSFLFEDVNFPDLPRDSWCISPDRGFAFIKNSPPSIDTTTSPGLLRPYSTLPEFGRSYIMGEAVRLGQCYRATGEETYFVYGQFYSPADDNFCLINPINGLHLQFSEVLDNFKLEKFEPRLCCDTLVCDQESIDFSPSFRYYAIPASQQIDYVWNDGVVGVQRTFTKSGYYDLSIQMDCGSKRTNRIFVDLDGCRNKFAVANAFSPNGDGLNDFIKPQWKQLYNLVSFEFAIYDRWGNQVYHSLSPEARGWDGVTKGRKATMGVYLWYLSYETDRGGKRKREVLSGDLLLVR